mmetsp:Transcript_12184/g.26356  ORF Transcript_12184/g.26356 Transcript_12184/m.26356 type:complete len:100 (+) Transcript_12184:1411-1710(+)
MYSSRVENSGRTASVSPPSLAARTSSEGVVHVAEGANFLVNVATCTADWGGARVKHLLFVLAWNANADTCICPGFDHDASSSRKVKIASSILSYFRVQK